MNKGARISIVLVSAAVAVGLILFGIFGYLRTYPPTVVYTPSPTQPHTVDVTLQVDGTVGAGPHPSWVGWYAKDAQGKWVRTTLYQVPVKTYVHVTVYEYDSGGPLRNPYWGKITGTVGNDAVLNGRPVRVLDAAAGNGVAHTMTAPALNLSVPMWGLSGTEKTFCQSGPCTLANAHNTETFTFYSGNVAHNYRWQCFIPCGAGFLNGNGGPMTSTGYMAGFWKVVA
ncbi:MULTISPECIES: hypothetical protein [Ferrimicrobium]|uniref:Uncharacterized protein n=1 Tax=Ferrimicrobium acidiphilum TaxID=121039 RepID=A0ABV3Y011_9ACTN|nr:hypothetical protein [Ferrimicrobium sp.]